MKLDGLVIALDPRGLVVRSCEGEELHPYDRLQILGLSFRSAIAHRLRPGRRRP